MTEEQLATCELAAQAVGVKTRRMPRNVSDTGLFVVDDDHGICGASAFFEPFDDDAQAFRIAAHLCLKVDWYEHRVSACSTIQVSEHAEITHFSLVEPNQSTEARRRAMRACITRSAVEAAP